MGVGESLPADRREDGGEPAQVGQVTLIEREHALVEVTEQVERLDAHIGSMKTTLEKCPEVFDAVGVDLAVDVLLGVLDRLVSEVGREAAVSLQGVCVDGRAGGHIVPHLRLQSGPRAVGSDGGADSPTAVQCADHRRLVHPAGAVNLAGALGLVHVTSLATDERFIDFDGAVKLLEAASLHGEPDAVKHEPRRLLCDAKRSGQFVRRDAILGVGNQPNRGKPLVETQRRVLEDRPDLDGELLLTCLALPNAARPQIRVFRPLAPRTNRPGRPTETGDELGADVQVSEVTDSFEECGRERLRHHVGECTTLRRVSQVYQSLNKALRVSRGDLPRRVRRSKFCAISSLTDQGSRW